MMLTVILTLTGISDVAQSFQVPSALQYPQQLQLDRSYRRQPSKLKMMTPDQVHDILVTASMQHGLDVPNQLSSHVPFATEIFTRSTTDMTQWIADAATSAVDKAQDDGGWWKAYINVFKSILTFVHSTVDGPLRSIGIEQTWGVSIFLFTASE